MNLVVCPHCKSHRIVTARVPKDVVVVMSCPSCGELVVLFRKKVIALDRRILEEGNIEDKKEHLAEIIAEFLEPGMFGLGDASDDEALAEDISDEATADEDEDTDSSSWLPPISERELDDFAKIQLEQLDDADYFRKHFG